MITYLFKFDTNYEEAAIIVTTEKGLDYAKEKAKELGAWYTSDVTIIDTLTEGATLKVNYGD